MAELAPLPVPTDPFHSPLGRLLSHPQATVDAWRHQLAGLLTHAAAGVLAQLAPLAAPTFAVLAGAAVLLTLVRVAAGRGSGTYLQLLAPPQADPRAERRAWALLHDALPAGWRRVLLGAPRFAFEYRFDAAGLHIGLWAARRVPRALLFAAVAAGWPGASAQVLPAPPVLVSAGALARVGRMRLHRAAHYPLAADDGALDPLAPLLAAAVTSDPTAGTVVQLLARPATGRLPARGRRAAAALRTGAPAGRTARLLGARRAPASSPLVGDPGLAAEIAEVLRKAEDSGWAVAIRYAVSTRAVAGGLVGRWRARRALAGRAHPLASAFTAYTGVNRLRRARLRRGARRLNTRALSAPMWLSTAELTALAHLPRDPATPGLQRAGARPAPPPADALAARDADDDLTDTAASRAPRVPGGAPGGDAG